MMRKHMSVKKIATDEVCVFSGGKTAEKRECFSSKIYLIRRKTFEDRKVCFIFLIFEKKFFEIYIKFACWWWFCCRSAKHFHIVLCVWICNSELRHVRIFVTPCSFYVLLQWDGRARCSFGIKMPVGWQNFIENPNCPDCVGWSKEQSLAVSPHGIVDWPIEQNLLWDRHKLRSRSRAGYSEVLLPTEQLSKCALLCFAFCFCFYGATDCIIADYRGTQREYSSKPLKHSDIVLLNVF